MPSTTGVSVSPVLWKSCNQIPLAFKARFCGNSVSSEDPQAGKPDVGFSTFTTVKERLWYYCSPVCRSPTWWVWDLILSWLCPSYHLAVASLPLDMEYIFLIGSNILLSMVVQQLVVILVLSQDEMSARSSTPPSETGKTTFTLITDFQTIKVAK